MELTTDAVCRAGQTSQGHEMDATKETFFQVIRGSNPFDSKRVTSLPDENDSHFVDVEEIHATYLERLKGWTNDIRGADRSLGVLLTGNPGTGKSHLLARYCRWAKKEKTAFYVYLHNVMASPEWMSRHLLRSVMSALVEGRDSFDDCMLYHLVHQALKTIIARQNLPRTLNREVARKAFVTAMQDAGLRPDRINAQIITVLFAFFEKINASPEVKGPAKAFVNNVVDWLSGNSISEEAAQEIGLQPQSDDLDEEKLIRLKDEHHIEQVLLVLGSLSGIAGRALLICLDQADNLTEAQIRSLMRFLHALLDSSKHLIVVTSGVRETLISFLDKNVITEAQRDRIAEQHLELPLVPQQQIRKLLAARLRRVRQRFQQVAELRLHFDAHAYFPLSEKEYEEQFGSYPDVRPRQVLKWASDAWETERDRLQSLGPDQWLKLWDLGTSDPPVDDKRTRDEIIDAAVNEALNEAIAGRLDHPGALPPDADNLATVVQQLARHCIGRPAYTIQSIVRIEGRLPPYHLEAEEKESKSGRKVTSGVAFIATNDGRSSVPALRRLLQCPKALDHRILITDEERAPLPQTPTSKDLYSDLVRLKSSRFLHIKLTFQQYVELDSLRSVIVQAADILIEHPRGSFNSLTPEEVAESLHRQNRLVQHPVLQELLTEPTTPIGPETPPPPTEEEVRTIILGNLGWMISITTNEVTQAALQNTKEVRAPFEAVHELVVTVARKMVGENLLATKDHQNGLLLLQP
ncbi:AAA family ATPase [Planctomyces sp. SH-PL14]|uniref:AAA family ATPase n=1 Tax=Planctomyces sp. SH-PL14 TaxID=1632864 RepID=UPI00078E00DA|nr:AAA family ATPase [Planctomyces sp. SH-PL14]AMV21846.1 hypothetical protein VT03_28350 [Planctomyces sp. SH-PL14]